MDKIKFFNQQLFQSTPSARRATSRGAPEEYA